MFGRRPVAGPLGGRNAGRSDRPWQGGGDENAHVKVAFRPISVRDYRLD
jgi:hypothetical protein